MPISDGLPRSTAALNQTINNAIEHKLKESIALLDGKLDATTAAMWEDIRSHIREAQHLQTENYVSSLELCISTILTTSDVSA